jgi:hypothetical protein
LTQENPTAGNSGASIEDRLVAYLSDEPREQQPKEQPAEPVKAETAEVPETQTQSEQPKEGDQSEDDGPQVSTADLAKMFGVDESVLDVDADGTLSIKGKIDGKETPAKLADLLKDYQIRGHAENKAREAAEVERRAQARMQEVEQHAQARLQNVEALTSLAKQDLMQEFQSINWQALEQQDAGQAALLKQKFQERANRLNGVEQYVGQQKQAHMANMDNHRKQVVMQEAGKLAEVIPEWKDAEVRQKETQEIWKLAAAKGVPPEILSILSDGLTTPFGVVPPSAGLIAIIRAGLMQQKLQESKPQIENKVRQAPKIVKPGQAPQSTKETRARDLKQSVQKSGGKHGSLEAYLIATGKV